MDRNGLRTLPAGVFAPLAALTRLDLADNSLRGLPSGVFDNLSGLITLNILRNDIASLSLGVFDELGSLAELNLGRNLLAALPEGIFTDLTELKTLSLGDNRGSLRLTDGVFDGLEGLLWLKIRGAESLPAPRLRGHTGSSGTGSFQRRAFELADRCVRQPEPFDRAQPFGKSYCGGTRRYLCQLDRAEDIVLGRQQGVAGDNRRRFRRSGGAAGA